MASDQKMPPYDLLACCLIWRTSWSRRFTVISTVALRASHIATHANRRNTCKYDNIIAGFTTQNEKTQPTVQERCKQGTLKSDEHSLLSHQNICNL